MADRDKMGAPGYQEFKAEELRTAEMGGVRAVIIAGKEAPSTLLRRPTDSLNSLTHSLTHSSRRARAHKHYINRASSSSLWVYLAHSLWFYLVHRLWVYLAHRFTSSSSSSSSSVYPCGRGSLRSGVQRAHFDADALHPLHHGARV